jgi:glycosyltransferase involved in cell wall biosynthesis
MGSVLGNFGEILSIYHVVDEYSGYTGQDHFRRMAMQQSEERLLDAVDLSIVVSPQLHEAKRSEGRKIFVVPNAVDFEAFSTASKRSQPPPDLAEIPWPRIGYSGLIGVRLNLDLVNEAAAARPDFQFVFVGSVDRRECEVQLQRLEERPNVHFLGEKPVALVPDYVSGFHVGMLPYRMNLETCHISPLKLYEYLAAGLPVVSSPIPSARSFVDLIVLAEGSAEFCEAMDIVLADDSEDAREKRLATARENTWDDRVRQIESIIVQALCSGQSVPNHRYMEPIT